MRTHQDIRDMSLALHRAVAAKLRRQPELLATAKETLGRWRAMEPQSAADRYLDAWGTLLEAGLQPTLAMLVEETEWAADLRQCSPFTRVLSQEERAEVLAGWRANRSSRCRATEG